MRVFARRMEKIEESGRFSVHLGDIDRIATIETRNIVREMITSGVDVPVSILLALAVAIEHEVLEAIGQMMVGKEAKVVFVEFEFRRVLIPNLG
jgi:hypothetical protein